MEVRMGGVGVWLGRFRGVAVWCALVGTAALPARADFVSSVDNGPYAARKFNWTSNGELSAQCQGCNPFGTLSVIGIQPINPAGQCTSPIVGFTTSYYIPWNPPYPYWVFADGSTWAGPKVNPSQPGWPPTQGVQLGHYKITDDYTSLPSNTNHHLEFECWIVGGVWKTALTPAEAALFDSANGCGQTSIPDVTITGLLTVQILNPTGGIPADSDFTVSLRGPEAHDYFTDGTGKAYFYGLSKGVYQLSVHNNDNSRVANRTLNLVSQTSQLVTVAFDGSGNPTVSSGDDPNTTSGGWLSDTLRSLFIPKQSSIDALKRSMDAFIRWGPFNFVLEVMDAMNISPNGAANVVDGSFVGLPVIQYNRQVGQAIVPWSATTTQPVTDSGLSQSSNWSFLRNLMGGGVYIAWGWFFVKKLIPKQTM